jgi:GDP-4-dehydro-6-deoxy-D-mannose reductase
MAPEIQGRHGYELVLPPPEFELFNEAQVDALLSCSAPDAILHLAGQPSVSRSFSLPEDTLRVNLLGTLRLFEGIKRARLSPRVVFPSSGEVYGQVSEAEMPVHEDRLPRPRNPYAVSKLAAEALCYQWSRTEGLQVVIARPFNHIGAGQSDSFALPAFARQIAEIKAGRRDSIIEVGDIDVFRDFTHVEDVIEGYLLLFCKGEPGEVYNIASSEALSIRNLLDRMIRISGVKAEIRVDPARFRPSEQRVVSGCNDKIKALGWHPSRQIDAALKDIIEDWENRTSHG